MPKAPFNVPGTFNSPAILDAAHAAYLVYDSTIDYRDASGVPKLGAWTVLSDVLLSDADTHPVSALLEINFMQNTTFDQKWIDDSNNAALRNSVAQAIADAIISELE